MCCGEIWQFLIGACQFIKLLCLLQHQFSQFSLQFQLQLFKELPNLKDYESGFHLQWLCSWCKELSCLLISFSFSSFLDNCVLLACCNVQNISFEASLLLLAKREQINLYLNQCWKWCCWNGLVLLVYISRAGRRPTQGNILAI